MHSVNLLSTSRLTLTYDREPIIINLDLEIPTGKITTLVGPNGCGKSTLLRGLARLLKPNAGTVYLDGAEIFKRSTKAVARRLGLLPQGPVAPEGLKVRDLVAQGRYPYQRAWIAMALAQDTEILLLDEPTTFLDLAHQVEVLDLLYELNQNEGRTIVMVLHDLNQACRYTDYLVAIRQGQVYARGEARQVMTEAMVREVFELECRIVPDPVAGTPMCVPMGRRVKLRKG
jgi:iron complex transport system ATP-binding protein